MSRWFKYDTRPSKDYTPEELCEFFDKVSEWALTSKTGRIKVKKIKDKAKSWANYSTECVQVKIKNKSDAALFELFFGDYIFNSKDLNVIIPLLRRAMPSIIANDIIGVQPMTGPVASIYSMKVSYQNSVVQANAIQKVSESILDKMRKELGV